MNATLDALDVLRLALTLADHQANPPLVEAVADTLGLNGPLRAEFTAAATGQDAPLDEL